MEDGDQLFRDITNNGNNSHSLRPRTPEGKAVLSKKKSKENPDWVPEGGLGMVTGRVTGSRVKFLAADKNAFLPMALADPTVEGKQKMKRGRPRTERRNNLGEAPRGRLRIERVNRLQEIEGEGGARPGKALQYFPPGVPNQQVNVRPLEEMQGEGDGAVHQVKVETPEEEVALVGVVPEEANDLELASRKLKFLKKRKEFAERRVQSLAEKIEQQTQIVKNLAGLL